MAKLLRSTVIKGAATPFVMELPPYRLPTFKGLLIPHLGTDLAVYPKGRHRDSGDIGDPFWP